jgi:phosphatidylglycerophosphate synthase
MPNVEKHQRENKILLGFLERPALKWLAAHMPGWVTPDTMTWLGILAAVLIFISYSLTHINPAFLWLASLGFILNWMGDSLDGTLARYRHIERPRYGFLVDHWVDAISTLLIFMGLGLSPYVDLTVASFGVIAYLLLSIMVYLITYVTNVFNITNLRLGPTEIRVLAILSNTAIFFIGNPTYTLPYFGATSLYTLIVGVMAFAMFVYFMINTALQARRLALLDQKRLERRQDKENQGKEEKSIENP